MYYKIKAAIKPLIPNQELYKKVKLAIKGALDEHQKQKTIVDITARAEEARKNTRYSIFGTIIGSPYDSEVTAAGVYRVIQIGNTKPYVCISASRSENTNEENNKRNLKLAGDLKNLGLYSYDLLGVYRECPKEHPKYPSCPEEEKKQVVENSFFIPYSEKFGSLEVFIETLEKLRDDFGQENILVGLPEKYKYDKEVILVDGKELKTGQHYYVKKDSIESAGKELTLQTVKNYGSIAIDPHKNRIIDWTVAVVEAGTISAIRTLNQYNIIWSTDNKGWNTVTNERHLAMLKERGRI